MQVESSATPLLTIDEVEKSPASKDSQIRHVFRLTYTAGLTVAGLAQSVERLTAEREVAGSIPGAGPLLRVLK